MVCSFIAVYILQAETPQPPQDVVEAFGQRVAVFSVWPYWREPAHSMSLRFHVPPLPIPFRTQDMTARFKPCEGPPDL